MGQKVNPTGIRLGIVKDWNSIWYADGRDYADNLNTDIAVREFIRKKLAHASVSRIEIQRPAKNARIVIHTARPGIVIGKKGEDIDALRKEVSNMMGVPVHIGVEEIRKPELDAYLVAENIAGQLVRRIMFRRAMKRAVTNSMRLGAEGIKVKVSGRLNGAEIARSEWYREGRVPLHTLRADVDFGNDPLHDAAALITLGEVGLGTVNPSYYFGEIEQFGELQVSFGSIFVGQALGPMDNSLIDSQPDSPLTLDSSGPEVATLLDRKSSSPPVPERATLTCRRVSPASMCRISAVGLANG